MAIGRAPLSIQDMLEKQKVEKELAAKPKFLTKAERAAIALEKRQQELTAVREKQDLERKEREELEKAAEEERRKQYDGGRYGNNAGGNGGRYGQQGYNQQQQPYQPQQQRAGYPNNSRGGGPPMPNQPRAGGPPAGPRGQYTPSPLSNPSGPSIPTGPRNGSNLSQQQTPSGPSSRYDQDVKPSSSEMGNVSGASESAAPPSEAELNAIRSRYLGAAGMVNGPNGTGPKKPRARKLQDKKFVFDWDAADDTSASEQGTWRNDMKGMTSNGEMVPVGDGIGTMFGGRLAGYDEGGRRKGPAKAVVDNHADALERRRAGRTGIDDRHWSEKPLTEMKERDWRIFREDFSIATRGGSIPHPLRSWSESAIPHEILKIIDEIGYKEPSPIQRQAIPVGLQNRDLIGIAQTGSGKTAAFVIPMLEYISHLPALTEDTKHLGPFALILAPTRELAQQIESETKRFAAPMGYKTVSIVGGRAVEEQQFNLREGAEIIIATPGRLKDIIDRNILVLSQCRYVVMDEADRMVDLGFEHDLTFILSAMPAEHVKPDSTEVEEPEKNEINGWKGYRVTTLFSATMPPIVERLAKQYLRKPATVVIGNAGEAVDTVEQRVEFVGGEDKKKNRLIEILRSIGLPPPMIVFVNEKKTADMVVRYVQQSGRKATTLHSGKNQEQREAALQSLRDGEVEVLVATDLAGRGIDVPDVSCVINWQMASTIEKYVHRIGRTGRAGKTGIAITFLGASDEEVMYDLRQEISKSPISPMNSELNHHPAARTKITREMKRKRDEDE